MMISVFRSGVPAPTVCCAVGLLLVCAGTGLAETIWSEDFTGLDGKGVDGAGTNMIGVTKWTVDTSDCNLTDTDDYLKVVTVSSNERMEAQDLEGEGVWTSESIDLSSYQDIQIAMDLSETGTMEAGDYIRVYYQLDGGPEQLGVETNGDFTALSYTETGLVANSLTLLVRVNNSSVDEKHRFDNIVVAGTPATNVQFGVGSGVLAENAGSTDLPVIISSSAAATVAVAIAGSAVWGAGNDFTNSTTNIVFSAGGSVTQHFSIYLLDDTAYESSETVELSLVNPNGATVGSRGSYTLTVRDDDAIRFQGLEGDSLDNWSYAENPDSDIDTTTDKAAAGTNSLRLTGTSTAVFDNVSLLNYKDVSFAIAFAADGPDMTGDEDLYAELSYDGGTTWTDSIKLIDGFNGTPVDFGTTNASDPTTVSPNPYAMAVANTRTQVRARVRVNDLDAAEYYYVDDVTLWGALRDNDSTVVAPDTQVAGTTIPSLADTPAEAVSVFRFKITDSGGNDGDPTQLMQLTIKPEVGNTADWSDTIQDVILKHGTTNIAVDSVSIADTSITIALDAGSFAIPDGTSREVTMSLYLNTSGIADNGVLQFRIDADAHGVTSDYATGSGFKADFGSDVVSGSFTLTVVATELAFATRRPPTVVGLASDFDVEVRAVDANDNRDTNAVNAVSLYKASGIGTLSSAGLGLDDVALTNGTRHWTDVRMSAPGTFMILAGNAALGTVRSDEIVAGGVWINEVDYDNDGDNTNVWIEFAGTAGLTLDDYDLVLIDSGGDTYATWDLSAGGLQFTDEHNGFGFVVWGIVPPAQGAADYTPPGDWTLDEIQVGPNDSLQLRRKDGSNSHLVDYEGNNTHTDEDQATSLADNNTDLTTSLYLTGGPGSWFSAFTWTNRPNQSTPGTVNDGQLLHTPSNAPALSNGDGASATGPYGAVLNGALLAGYPFPRVYVCWSTNSAGTSTSAWDNVIDMGIRCWGDVVTNISSLVTNTTYYYRCYATNVKGIAWTPVTNFTTTGLLSVSPDYAVYIDDVGLAAACPACVDRDANGLSDTWEEQYLDGTGNNAYGDKDSDGVANIREYIAGTDPDDNTSYMRAISLDLPSESSSSITLRWVGGTHEATTPFGQAGDRVGRHFAVQAADNNAGLAKSRVATVSRDSSGTNAWTDVDAANRFESRYYNVSAIVGGMAYTNTEEWAMHVQARGDGCKYLVSVPVNLAPGNNLNSSAGVQLGRGLFAGQNATDSDRMYYRTSTNSWQEYYLVTNASGQALWWDFDAGAQADLTITPGMGFWVERRTGTPRTRATCVFAGPSHVSAPPITIRTNDNIDGWAWNVFGWPFAERKQHQNLGVGSTPSNQLGFAAIGYGGTTAHIMKPHEQMGDQIWVWETNRFTRYYWLMDGVGDDFDGRWVDRFTGDFADFTLKPGQAFFYRHHVATNGTETGVEFQWQPVTP